MKARGLLIGVAFCAASVVGSTAHSQAKDEKKPAADKPAAGTQPPPPVKPADKPESPPTPSAAKPADKPGAPPAGADMASMMKMFQEMSAPGKEHESLKPMVGSFSCTNKFYMAPGAPPMESSGEVTRRWVLGNRYIEEDVKATMMGTPFEGFGIAGYDKLQKMYHTYWIDSMGTGWWFMTGTADAAGKVFTFTGENFDPMANMKKKGKSTLDMSDANKHVMKMYDTAPDGKEFLAFEMTCTRK
jgi:hypothetical protein